MDEGTDVRTAVVTGAARGIGRAIAVRLAADGLDLTVSDVPASSAELDQLADQLVASGWRATAVTADVRQPDVVTELVAGHVGRTGGLDVMVANAGIAVTAPLVETTPEQWEDVWSVNLMGVVHCYRAAIPAMIARGRGGRLIAAASVASHRAGRWQSAYSATKFAVRGLTQSVAQEVAEHGITANVYSPGVVDTPLWTQIDGDIVARTGAERGSAMNDMLERIPLARFAEPEDVAAAVSFLASPDSAYVTGQSMVIDGGMWFS